MVPQKSNRFLPVEFRCDQGENAAVAEISTPPQAIAVTSPEDDTVAMLSSDVAHTMSAPLITLPFASWTDALS